MNSLKRYNPVVILVYFISVSGIAMFCNNPVVIALSFVGSLSLFFASGNIGRIMSHAPYFLMFIVFALINPLFYHNGVTVLFMLNDNPITLEALIYGIFSSAMIISVIYWFRSFSKIMTSDRLLYIFGAASPKLALILSMALRYIPLFGAQAKKVNNTQKALGLYKEDNIIDSIRGGMRVFSVMVTWTLENGIIAADSMTARGYGIGRRTFFSLYAFRKSDAAFLSATLLPLALTVAGISLHAFDFDYYPATSSVAIMPASLISYISYGILAFLPSILEISEDIKWKYLRSKI